MLSVFASRAGMLYSASAAQETFDLATKFKDVIFDKAQVLVIALIVLIVGWYLVNMVCKIIGRALEKSKIDTGAAGFINSLAKFGLRLLLFIVVISKLGVDMTSIIALFTSAALAIGLAMQGFLTNLAGGLLLLIMKPFKVGDFIDDGSGHAGTVKAVEMIYTQIVTLDNQTIWIPNGTLANSTVTNVSSLPFRILDFKFTVPGTTDIDQLRQVLTDTAKASKNVDLSQEPFVFIDGFDGNKLITVLRIKVLSENYWDAKFEVQEAIKRNLDANGITLPGSRMTVTIEDKK